MPITSESNISQVGDPRDGKDNNTPPPNLWKNYFCPVCGPIGNLTAIWNYTIFKED